MKKILTLTLAVAMALSIFAGCARDNTDKTTASTDGSSSADVKSPTVEDIYSKIENEIGKDNLPMFTETDDDMFTTYYYADLENVDSYIAKMPAISVKADEFFIAKAKEGKAEEVKKGLEKRLEDLDAQWKQYLPEQYDHVKNAKLVVNGDYVLLAIGPDAEKAVKIFDEETK